MKNIEKIFVLILSVTFLILCYVKNYVFSFYHEGEGFEWDTWAYTSKSLPIMFADCDFHHTGYRKGSFQQNIVLYGDNINNSISCESSGIGEEKNLYPNNLNLLYYSFTEKKFYGGKFKIEYDKIQSVATRLRKAVSNGKEKFLRQAINFKATVYPKGKIVVSMESYIKTSIGELIIAEFQASPEVHNWSVFNNENYSGNKITGISTSNSIEIQNALLMERYNWQLEILLPKNHTTKSLDVGVYGNKSLNMDTIRNTKIPSFNNFIYMPQALSLSWQRMDTIEFSAGFKFDEKEIINAFHSIDKQMSEKIITVQIIVKNDTTKLKAVVKGDNKSFELKNLNDEKVYPSKIYN